MITLDRLGKKFDHWVFRNISFELDHGKSLAIIGPSGSGKSVLLKTIAGLLDAEEGTLSVKSPNLGMLFQKNALFNSLTVEENLLFPLRENKGVTGKTAIERARYFLQEVGLSGTQKLFPDELSGGMQKRLGIARALIVNPEVILYDEPTAGLDPITSRMIAELIRNLQTRSGSTVIAVTNDIRRAYQLGDQIALLAPNLWVMGGSPADVQASRDPAIYQFVRGLNHGPLQ